MSGEHSVITALTGRELGDYVLGERIGEGGMGEVYRARQRALERTVVVKVLRPDQRSDPTAAQRFLREAHLASSLEHPFAAHVYDFAAEPDGLLWIAMELVRGTPLNYLLREGGPWPLGRWVPLLERLCEVVHAAHEQGIIHRDLKPANVMVISHSGRFSPKLLDLGVARISNREALSDERSSSPTLNAIRAEPQWTPGHETSAPPVATVNTLPPIPGPPVMEEEPATAAIRPRALALATASAEGANVTRTSAPGIAQPATPATPATPHGRSLDVSTDELTSHLHLLGTPPYMAPELWADGKAASAASDIYALGVTTFEVLAGRRPYPGGSLLLLQEAHARGKVPSLGPGFSPAVDAVIRRAMAADPQERFPTALAFAQELRHASQLDAHADDWPRLDAVLQQRFLAEAPAPIADTLSMLDVATTADAYRRTLERTLHALAWWFGLVALGARMRVRTTADAAAAVRTFQEQTSAGTADTRAWLELTAALVQPFAKEPEAHPVPELVSYFYDRDGAEQESLARFRALTGDSEGTLGRLTELSASVLRASAFVCDFDVCAEQAGRLEYWGGTRRRGRRTTTLGLKLKPGEVVLLDREGLLAVPLSPLVQVEPPSPGAPPELFLLAGQSRLGARMTALPLGFERHDAELWSVLTRAGLAVDNVVGAEAEVAQAPYQGLSSFTATEASYYFGREREAEAAANRLRERSLLCIVGPSGVGKSSFVQAGLMPLLPREWKWVLCRPGSTPLQTLEAKLLQAGLPAQGLAEAMRADPAALRELLRRGRASGARAAETWVVVVDQFEELITLTASEPDRRTFAQALLLASQSGGESKVVLAFRDDFLIRIKQLPPLREVVGTALELLTTPSSEDLARILTEPARLAGVRFEDTALVEEMVRTVADQPGALALLSFSALKLWELRDRRHGLLTWKAYRALGGVGGALAQHAEEVLAQLSELQRRLVQQVFRHLVTSQGTRAIMSRAEMVQVFREEPAAADVVDRLIDARLLVSSEAAGGEDRIEVIHETLLGSWPRLVGWQREDAENARMRDQLRAAARQWDEAGRPKGVLWRGETLTEFRIWRARNPGALTRSEEAFIVSSQRADDRARQVLRGAFAAGVLGLLTALGVVFHSMQEARASVMKLFVEQGRQALLADDPLRALTFLREGKKLGARSAALDFMLGQGVAKLPHVEQVYLAGNSAQWSTRFSPDETLVLSAGKDGVGRVFDRATGTLRYELRGHGPGSVRADWSPDGATLVTGSADGTAALWSARDGKRLRVVTHGAVIREVSFTPDSRAVLTSGVDGFAKLWEVSSGRLLRRFAAGGVGPAFGAIDPQGTSVIVAGVGGVGFIYDLATGARRVELKGHAASVRRVAFGHAGRIAVTLSDDKTARVWDVRTGKTVAVFAQHTDPPEVLAISPDNAWVVTGSAAGSVFVWSARTGALRYGTTLEGEAWGVAFSPDGRRFAAGSMNGTLKLWSLEPVELLRSYPGQVGGLFGLLFSRDGEHLLSAGFSGNVRLLDVKALPYRLRLHPFERAGQLNAATYSEQGPSGRLYTAAQDRAVRVFSADGLLLHRWDELKANDYNRYRFEFARPNAKETLLAVWTGKVAQLRGAEDFSLVRELKGHTGEITWLAWSPDNRYLATASEDNSAILWDTESGKVLAHLPHADVVVTVDFSPDSHRLLTASADHHVRIFSVPDGKVLLDHEEPTNLEAASFAPDGKRFVVGGDDKVGRIEDAASGAVEATLVGNLAHINSALFSPDGRWVLTAGGDGTARLWDAKTGIELDVVGRHASELYNAAFSRDGREVFTDGVEGDVRVWPLHFEAPAPLQLDELARCWLPYRVDGERVVLTEERRGCPGG